MSRTVSSAVFLAVLLATTLITGTVRANEVRVLEESDTEIVIELATNDYVFEDVVHGGETFVRVVARGLEHTTEPGLPALPMQGVLIGVPFGAEVSLDVLSFESEELGVLQIEPAPTGRFVERDDFTFAVEDYDVDQDYHRGGRTHPSAVASLGFDTTLRHQRVIQVLLHPFQYSPSTGRLTLHRSITVRLKFSGRGRPAGLTDVHAYEPEWEQLYAGTVLNYEGAGEWRLRPEPARTWKRAEMRQDHEVYKLTIVDPGITRLSFSDLSAEGLPEILGMDEIAIYQRSYDENAENPFVEIATPILVFDENENGFFDGSDYLLFYAQSFEQQHMPVGYEDRYTDENVYWFGWGEELAERMGTRTAWHGWTGLVPPASFSETARFEEDALFTRVPASDVVDLCLWTDYSISSGDDHELPFHIYDVNYSEDARVRARYQGMSSSGHDVTISIIDGNSVEHSVGAYLFHGLAATMEEHIFDVASVPATYFTDGENTFRTRGTVGPSIAYLDWFEITYGRRYVAREGCLRFTNGGETGDTELRVTELSSSSVRLFDVTDPWDPVVFTLSPENIVDAGGSYTLVLQDEIAELARYEVVEDGSYRTPEGIERREPANLFEQEADLIVVSYEGFSSGVEPLIAHRESEGHVVTHAMLHDVYDEFFGGLVDPQALKNYFKYAFYEWTRQPQFALLVGDASEDARGVTSTSAPNYMPTYITSLTASSSLIGSDEWMVTFVDETPYLPQMYIGRLPVGSSGQLSSLVSRILAYENASSAGADWRNEILFVADDVWSYGSAGYDDYTKKESSEGKFTTESIVMAETVAASPAGMDTVMFMLRRYTDPYHGELTEDDPIATWQFVKANVVPVLLDKLSESALVVNFQGHANKHQLAHECLLVDKYATDDFDSIENDGKPFIFFGFACSIARFFDYYEGSTGYDCFAEQLLFLDDDRGAVASFASTGLEYLTPNVRYNKKIFEAMFTDPTPTGPPEEFFWPRWSLGGILGKAAVKYVSSGGSGVAARRFVLLGDPLLHIEASPPTIQVAVDGAPHASGDYLESSAGEVVQIVADIIDEVEINPATISVVESDLGEIDPELYLVEAVTDTGAQQSRWYRLTYNTEIRDWSYGIRISASDVNGQRTTFTLHVAEGNRILIRDVANHPNPFDRTTSIIYLLNQSGAEVEVKIYTVGGRLIEVFEDAPNDLNYNALVWDGKDRDGDTVANGVYLFTIEARGEDGSSAMTPVGRMVKMR